MDWKRNYHTHTDFCDGQNTPEEMAEAAAKKGFTALGFSGHSYTDFDTFYCMTPETFPEYCRQVRVLREKYEGQMEILLGVERDFYSDLDCRDLDYSIGSVHYIRWEGEYIPVDESEEVVRKTIEKFGNDPYAYAETYFDTVARVVEQTDCDFIGHFDLIKKFNRNGVVLVDEQHPRYVAAWKKALERLVPQGRPFEINTTPLSWREDGECYPSREILKEICRLGGRITISSDAHSADHLNRGFDQALAIAKEAGFRTVTVFHGGGVTEEIPIE